MCFFVAKPVTQLKLPITLKKQAIERYLDRATKNTLNSSSRTFTQESPEHDSCVNQLKYKAISIWQPWASLIGLGVKTYETRSWQTNYRGKLIICSARKTTKQQQQDYALLSQKYQIDMDWDDLLFGYAIAICDITDCIKISNGLICSILQVEYDCGDWEIGRYAWKLENIKVLDNPTPVKGKQRLWNLFGVNPQLSQQELLKHDSCVNPRLTAVEHASLLSYLTQKNTAQRKYGSGWLSLTKAGGTARTDNRYLVYYYRQHWRKRPYAVHIGNQYRHQVLEIGRKVREAIDRDRPPLEIEKMIKDAKSNSN